MKFIFDTEATGLTAWHLPASDPVQPHLVQLAGLLLDEHWRAVSEFSLLVKPEGFEIPFAASNVHGITTEKATRLGVPLKTVLSVFNHLCRIAKEAWAYNAQFDELVMRAAFHRIGQPCELEKVPARCAMLGCTGIVKLPPKRHGDVYGWPKLIEAHRFFFKKDFERAHDALADVRATARVMEATAAWVMGNEAVTDGMCEGAEVSDGGLKSDAVERVPTL